MPPAPDLPGCFHGGQSITAAGRFLDQRQGHAGIISADVLDAWFPPAPQVLAVLEDTAWLARTSPPADAAGFLEAVSAARGVPASHLLPGAGSSDLIFRALLRWLPAGARVLLPDPTYGEYAHVLERVIGCQVDRLPLQRQAGYALEPEALRQALAREYALVVLVNPNSPTGYHLAPEHLAPLLHTLPPSTRVWIDETYIEYPGRHHSLERLAAASSQVFVCKSLSKVYALSGLRAAYLCGPADEIARLRAVTPPWVLSLPAQVAALAALQDTEYYEARYRETHLLREALALELAALGWEVIPGCANFLLCHLPASGPRSDQLRIACEQRGLYLRDAASMGSAFCGAIRIAVKDAATNRRLVAILRAVWTELLDEHHLVRHEHRLG